MRAWLDAEIVALGACNHDVVREEAGALPMEVGYRAPEVPGICHIGLAGEQRAHRRGMRFSASRCMRITSWLSFCAGRSRVYRKTVPSAASWTGVFLRVLAAAPERGPALFETLFRNTPADRLERFLSGINPQR